MDQINYEIIGMVAGILLSLCASYLPKFSDWYNKLEPTFKRLVMLGALLVVSCAVFGISCLQLESWVVCDKVGAWGLVKVFVLAMVANQGIYLLTPQKEDKFDFSHAPKGAWQSGDSWPGRTIYPPAKQEDELQG